MKTFNITDQSLYTKFKAKCVLKNKSMSQVIMEMMADFVKDSK